MPFDRIKAAEMLKSDAYQKASPEVKAAIVKRMREEAAADASNAGGKREAPAPVEDWQPADRFQHGWYKAADIGLGLLPAAGATVGGIAASEMGPAGLVGGGFAGGATGERAREILTRRIFAKDPDHIRALPHNEAETRSEEVKQGALGSVQEWTGGKANTILKRLAAPFVKSAASVELANSGAGIRLTPGEASGIGALQRIERVLGHLPGASGPIERFRAAQEADAMAMFEKQLDSLSAERLSDEDTGKAVQKIVREARKAFQQEQEGAAAKTAGQQKAHFDEVKRLLGVDSQTFMTPEQIDAAVAKKIEFYKQMGGGEPAVVAKLREARSFTRAASQKAVQSDEIEHRIMGRILEKDPEMVWRYLQKGASYDDLRQFNRIMPPQVRQQAAANVLQRIITDASDPQSNGFNQRAFAIALKRLDPVRGRLLFGPQYNAIMQGSAMLNRIAPLAGSAGGGLGQMHTMRTVIEVGGVAGTALGLSGNAYKAATAVGGPVVAMRLIGAALANPATSATVLKVLRYLTVAGVRGAAGLGSFAAVDRTVTTPYQDFQGAYAPKAPAP